MKAKRRMLTAATLSAFLSLAGVAQAYTGGGQRHGRNAGGKNWHTRHHRSGKKSTKGGKKGHKGRRRGNTTPPPK